MADQDSSVARWFVGIVIMLLAGGSGVVALLNFFSGPTIERFEASAQEVAANSAATLTWKVAQASSVEIAPEIGRVALEGKRDVRPTSTTTYMLVARRNWGTRTAEQRIVVVPRPDHGGGPADDGKLKTGSGTVSGGETGKADVILHNDTGSTVVHVYFGTARWGGWSGEQLSEAIPPGGTHSWSLQPGAGVYDLKAEDGEHRVLDQELQVTIHGTYAWRVDGRP